MKKILAFILILVCCFTFGACAKKETVNTTENNFNVFKKEAENDKYIDTLIDENFNGTWIVKVHYQSSMFDKVETFSVMFDKEEKIKEAYEDKDYESIYPDNSYEKEYATASTMISYLNHFGSMYKINTAFLDPLSDPKIKLEKTGEEVVAGVTCEKYLTTKEEQKMNILFCKDLRLVMKVWDNNLTYFEIVNFTVETGDVSIND